MAIFDILKKKKRKEMPKEKIEKIEKVETAREVQVKKSKRKKKVKKISEIPYRILKAPHITEKATALAQQNQYVFKVYPRANKPQIKKAIKSLYDVEVVSIKIINVAKKRRRLGRISGFRKGYKKAIIKIKEGQKIDIMPK